MREIHDHFFKRAKEQGYRSRAAFKLLEIDQRKRLLRRGDWVLDAGCAPGSWLQVLAERLGPEGRAVGVDLKETDPRGLRPTVRAVVGDLETVTLRELLGSWHDARLGAPSMDEALAPRTSSPGRPPFDVVVSDIGPDTTGDPSGDSVRSIRLCNTLLDRCGAWLRRGGHLAMKVYEGGEYPELLRRARALFEDAKGFKPDASRSESVEIYLIGKGWRGTAPESAPPRDPSLRDIAAARRKSGWG